MLLIATRWQCWRHHTTLNRTVPTITDSTIDRSCIGRIGAGSSSPSTKNWNALWPKMTHLRRDMMMPRNSIRTRKRSIRQENKKRKVHRRFFTLRRRGWAVAAVSSICTITIRAVNMENWSNRRAVETTARCTVALWARSKIEPACPSNRWRRIELNRKIKKWNQNELFLSFWWFFWNLMEINS